MDLSQHLHPDECPRPLRRWARQFVGRRSGAGGAKSETRRVAGWRWDGHSNEIVLVLAPKGTAMKRIPVSVWEQIT